MVSWPYPADSRAKQRAERGGDRQPRNLSKDEVAMFTAAKCWRRRAEEFGRKSGLTVIPA